MDIKTLILNTLKRKGEAKVADIVKATGFSRVYVNRFFRELKQEGKIALLGKTNRARYVLASPKHIKAAKESIVKEIKPAAGTDVEFGVFLKSKRELPKIFKEYAGEAFEFSTTKVVVNLYKMDTDYISRSQARRILSGLDKFKTIILDFKEVATAGQAFADEVFRVWQRRHSGITIKYQNANPNVEFMIQRAKAAE